MDEFVIAGGRAAAVRHDPTGHEDCAADWEPCSCHGDRLCRLGLLKRTYMSQLEHVRWMRGEREDTDPEKIMRIAGCRDKWELAHKISSAERLLVDIAREVWPLILANASLASHSRA